MAAVVLFCAGVSFTPVRSTAQTDNFNDGDDVGWVRYDPLGGLGLDAQTSWTFPDGAYRIRCNRDPLLAQAGPARGGAYRTNVYSDFYISADIVNWDDSMDQAIGLLARMTQLGFLTTDGYALTYQTSDHDIDITRFTDEGLADLTSIPLTPSDKITMVPGRSYRYVWIGKANKFTVRIYELPNLTTPVLECVGFDDVYPSGVCGFLVYDNSSGNAAGVADCTFDNYFALEVEPPRLTVQAGAFEDIIVSWPVETPDDFVLQTTASLSTTPIVWTAITSGITISGDGTRKEYYDTSSAGGNKFYRMVRATGPPALR
jgi:hypothetical protein